MKVSEAKDFLVNQIKQQAGMEGQSLSELEIRMLYFTERDNSEKAQELETEFDESYNMKAYEHKISRLMTHAYKREKQKDPVARKTWDDAIRRLQKGDHYILVSAVPPVLTLLVAGVFVLVVAAWIGIAWLSTQFAPPNPRAILASFIVVIALLVVFQRRIGVVLIWLLDRLVFRFLDRESGEND